MMYGPNNIFYNKLFVKKRDDKKTKQKEQTDKHSLCNDVVLNTHTKATTMRIWKPWRPNKEKVINDESLGISFCAEMHPDQKTFPSLHFQQKEICIKYNARQNRDAAKKRSQLFKRGMRQKSIVLFLQLSRQCERVFI